MRAIEPTHRGYATNPHDSVRSFYQVYGPADARRTLVMVPTWSLVHSRVWKMQVPYFARHGVRVVTFDGRGNGASDKPDHGYAAEDFARDTVAVMDDAGVDRAVLVAFSAGGRWATHVAVGHPERVERMVLIGPSVYLHGLVRLPLEAFLDAPPDREGWNKYNAVHWRDDYRDFTGWFAEQVFSEPHSTKGIDDIVDWSGGTTPETLIRTVVEGLTPKMREVWQKVTCPVLIVHGSDYRVAPVSNSQALQAALPHTELTVIDGGGHAPHLRDPVKVNLLLRAYVEREEVRTTPTGPLPARTWRRARARGTRRALFVSSPIGLGHAQRDVAIAKELRALVPGLEIDWLAQHPVTRVLEANGERIHPASSHLAGESPHIESWMGAEHELDVFEAIRDMDEILLANFHVFHDVASEGQYDLWIGDEAWEVDYHLHENPELKTAPFAWLTDFVVYLPMVGGERGRQARVTADYNAEMIHQVERFHRVRDAAIYIGERADIVPDRFGPDLPAIGAWVPEHYDLNGYIRYFDPADLGERRALRARFGFQEGERVVVAAVGGTSVGASLLHRIVTSYPAMREVVPNLRLVVVCGPRIEPGRLPQVSGVEYLGYVHDLFEMLAAADAAMVQGGLSTTMELVASGTPFLYFPLTHHFEQNRHVAHRLERYGVPPWARVTYAEALPETLATRLGRLLTEPAFYRAVGGGGARRAAETIAALL